MTGKHAKAHLSNGCQYHMNDPRLLQHNPFFTPDTEAQIINTERQDHDGRKEAQKSQKKRIREQE
jgi:hypothetical protein